MRRLLTAGVLSLAFAGGPAQPAVAPAPVRTAHGPAYVLGPAAPDSASLPALFDRSDPYADTQRRPLVADPLCPGVEQVAIAAGWPADPAVLATLDLIVFRESRCRTDAIGHRDPGSTGSVGWAQLNSAAWCDPTRWHPHGYLQEIGLIDSCGDLLDPLTNLRAALIVWQRAGSFSPWSTAP